MSVFTASQFSADAAALWAESTNPGQPPELADPLRGLRDLRGGLPFRESNQSAARERRDRISVGHRVLLARRR
jgi:hypothetical protein